MPETLRPEILADPSPSGQRARDAALIRAITELFTQETIHDGDEIRRYEELATHLISRVSLEDRVFVAERIATRADAPQSVIRLLAKDHIDVARPVIERSPVLGALDLLTVIAATGPEHHRIIAERPDLTDEVGRALAIVAEKEAAPPPDRVKAEEADAGETVSAASTHGITSASSTRSDKRGSQPDRFDAWQFLTLNRSARINLMESLAARPPTRHYSGAANRLDRVFRTMLTGAQIVGYARQGERQTLIATIAGALDLDHDVVAACLDDETGEPAAVLLKALGLDNVQAQQVFLLATRTIGLDVTAFFQLTDLYTRLGKDVAEILVEVWRKAGERAVARHAPHFTESGTPRRPSPLQERRPDRVPPAERARGS